MTICIAAIAKEGKKEYIVFATDHLVTTSIGQFEHSIVKYKMINLNTVAMIAGNALLFDDLTKLGNNKLPYEAIKLEIFNNLKKKREIIIQNEIFNVFGVDQTFFKSALEKEIPNPFVHSILDKVAKFRLGTGILLAGFDNNVAKISEINEEGYNEFRMMNFHAIGTGDMQAANTLLFQKHSKNDNLLTTIYNVYKAKRNAEVMEGVGKETELLILSEGKCKQLDEQDLEKLRKIYEQELKVGKENNLLKELNLGEVI